MLSYFSKLKMDLGEENKICSQVWLSEKQTGQKSMKFFQNSNHDHILIERDLYPPLLGNNECSAKHTGEYFRSETDEDREFDEDDPVFMDCEPFPTDTERFLGENVQFSKLKELCPEAGTEPHNIARKSSWKKKKCLSLDSRRWDNAKESISKGKDSG